MNSDLLKGNIRENGDTQERLAAAIGISNSNLSDKINGKSSFRQNSRPGTEHKVLLQSRNDAG